MGCVSFLTYRVSCFIVPLYRLCTTARRRASHVADVGVHQQLPHVCVELDAGLLVALPPQHAEQAHDQQRADAHLSRTERTLFGTGGDVQRQVLKLMVHVASRRNSS